MITLIQYNCVHYKHAVTQEGVIMCIINKPSVDDKMKGSRYAPDSMHIVQIPRNIE